MQHSSTRSAKSLTCTRSIEDRHQIPSRVSRPHQRVWRRSQFGGFIGVTQIDDLAVFLQEFSGQPASPPSSLPQAPALGAAVNAEKRVTHSGLSAIIAWAGVSGYLTQEAGLRCWRSVDAWWCARGSGSQQLGMNPRVLQAVIDAALRLLQHAVLVHAAVRGPVSDAADDEERHDSCGLFADWLARCWELSVLRQTLARGVKTSWGLRAVATVFPPGPSRKAFVRHGSACGASRARRARTARHGPADAVAPTRPHQVEVHAGGRAGRQKRPSRILSGPSLPSR